MSKTRMALFAIPLMLTFTGVGFGVELTDPDAGDPPQGFAFSDDSPGARVSGTIVFEFREVPLLCEEDPPHAASGFARGSAQMISVLRVRKAGKLAAFSHVTDCTSCLDACSTFPVCGAPPIFLVAQGKIEEIQKCLIRDLSEAVGEALFDDPTVDVKLKNVDEFIQALPDSLDPAIEGSDHFVADVELSVK